MPFRMVIGMTSKSWPAGWNQCAPAAWNSDFNFGSGNNFGMNSIVVDPVDQSVLVGCCYQGIFKSFDQGASWTKWNTGTGGAHIDSGRIWSMSLDPLNHNTVWATAGYGDGGPLKSTDGGVSWATAYAGSPTQLNDVYSVAVDPYTADHVLATWHSAWTTDGVNSGVSESSDGGATWTHHQPPGGSSWGAGNAVFFLNNSASWLFCSQTGGIWLTTNTASTWTQVSTNNIGHGGLGSLWTNPANADLYLTTDSNVLRSTNHGATWTDISTGLTGSGAGNHFDSTVTDGTNLYTLPSYPTDNYLDMPWQYMPIGGSSWTNYSVGSQHPSYTNPYSPNATNSNGPVMGAYDSVHKIGYAVHWLAGVWRIQG